MSLIGKAVKEAMGSVEISRISVNRLEQIGDKFVDKFDVSMDRLQAIVDSATFQLPVVATAGVVPYSVSGGPVPRGGASSQDNRMDRLLSLMERLVASGGFQKNASTYTFVGQLNGKEIFREVIREGQGARRSTGRNPFMLGGDR